MRPPSGNRVASGLFPLSSLVHISHFKRAASGRPQSSRAVGATGVVTSSAAASLAQTAGAVRPVSGNVGSPTARARAARSQTSLSDPARPIRTPGPVVTAGGGDESDTRGDDGGDGEDAVLPIDIQVEFLI